MANYVGYEASYVGQLRKLVGNRKLIIPAARAIVRDKQGRILLVRRKDNGRWGMPAGAVELDESILDCVKREVEEETGLDVVDATAIAIYSEPRFSSKTAYGAKYQMFAVVFLIDEWEGEMVTETEETSDARFFGLDELPDLPSVYSETIQDMQDYEGKLILK